MKDEKGRENKNQSGKLPFLTCILFLNKNHTYNHTQTKKVTTLSLGNDSSEERRVGKDW